MRHFVRETCNLGASDCSSERSVVSDGDVSCRRELLDREACRLLLDPLVENAFVLVNKTANRKPLIEKKVGMEKDGVSFICGIRLAVRGSVFFGTDGWTCEVRRQPHHEFVA